MKSSRYLKFLTVRPLTFVFFALFFLGTTDAQAAELEGLKTLKVPSADWTYIAQEKGWFKEIFGDKGIEVEIVEGTLGNEVQLLARGDVHFSGRMLYPYLIYKSQRADITAVQVSSHPSTNVASVVVLNESPYKTFDDLKGQKIGTWRAGCPFMVLVTLTDERQWKEGADWFHVNIRDPEYKNALLTGAVAAISCHPGNDITVMLENGSAREIAYPGENSPYIQGGGVTVIFTSNEFAKNYPNITHAYIDLQQSTQEWILKNQDEAGVIVEKITRVPANMSKIAWDRRRGNWAFSEKNLDLIKRETKVTIDWLESHGEIGKGLLNVENLFDSQFFD
jgi:ABC-type nitrate/sulfonate/bicarbonate transport system substrate-binding protein